MRHTYKLILIFCATIENEMEYVICATLSTIFNYQQNKIDRKSLVL